MLEANANKPGKTIGQKRRDEYTDTFWKWIRAKGQSSPLEQKLQDQYEQMRIHNDITIGTPSGGGYAVPEEISRMISVLEKKMSPVRDLIKIVQAGTSDYKELVDIAGESSGWVGETGTRSATTTPKLREVVPTHGELYAYPQVSEWSLDDIFFNVEDWLTQRVARDFAIKEATAVISGNGTNQPTGMLNTTPVTTADFASPLRAAAAYQYLASDLTPGGSGILADILIDTVYTLNSMYRPGAVWIMNSATVGAIRKLKDTTDQYLWQPGLSLGQPDRLLGYPISVWEQMPDIGTNNFPVGFGSWREAYVLVDRVGMRILRDNISAIGHVRFYVRRREGGIVLNNDAAKFIRTL
jgi:HK97 family phage major capsid protein